MRGASALNQLLADLPDARLRVQVVWEPVLITDVAPPATRVLALIDDRRVTQYWDPARLVSADIVRSVNADPARHGFQEALPSDFIVWDVVAVFEQSARWARDLPPPAYYGGPVVEAIEAAKEAVAEQVAGSSSPPATLRAVEASPGR